MKIPSLIAVCCLLVVSPFTHAQGGLGQGGGGGGGQGGIFIDPQGVLRSSERPKKMVRKPAPAIPADIANSAKLRRVSLKGLDQRLRERDKDQPLDTDLALLAGLTEIDYVLIDRDNEDVWLVGPAEPWEIDQDGRELSVESGRPILHLEDLVSSLRCVLTGQGFVDCSMDPQQEGLAAIQSYQLPTPKSRREAVPYQEEIAELYGLQTIRTSGVPQGSRFAMVMIEADYRMKRMALGLEPVNQVTSHMAVMAEQVQEGVSRRNMLARWWFAPLYTAIRSDEKKTVFEFGGPGVQILNEAVLLAKDGERSNTGVANEDWDLFAKSFTQRFETIEKKYPVYADLRNLFDLMMVAGLIQQQQLGHWFEGSVLLDDTQYVIPTFEQPRFAEAVVNFDVSTRKVGKTKYTYSTFGWGGVAMRPSAVFARELFQTAPATQLVDTATLFAAPVQSTATAAETPARGFWQDVPTED